MEKSSDDDKYRSMLPTTSKFEWIHSLLQDLPITLFCDNKVAQRIAQNPVFHERTKHLKIDCH